MSWLEKKKGLKESSALQAPAATEAAALRPELAWND
jgi:hypothetical protein